MIVRCSSTDKHWDLFVFYVFTNEIVSESKLSFLLIVFMSFSTWVCWRLICRILVWDFMLIFDLASRKIWTWSCLLNWFDWLKNFARSVELFSSMRLRSCQWLNVTYSFSRRKRNMILFLRTIVSIVSSTNSLKWKNTSLLISLLISVSWCWFFDRLSFDVISRENMSETRSHLMRSDVERLATFIHHCEWFLSFREMILISCVKSSFLASLIVKLIISIESKFRLSSLWWSY